MYTTTLLRDDTEGNREFYWSSLGADKTLNNSSKTSLKKQLSNAIYCKGTLLTYISKGATYLPLTNEIYYLEFLPSANIEIILPKPNKMLDWVVLCLGTTESFSEINLDNNPKIKVRSMGREHIMGFNEPLLCDLPFMSLRLTYTDHSNGWVIT